MTYAFYQHRVTHFTHEVSKLDTIIRNYSIGRVALALAFVAAGYLGFTDSLFFIALPVLLAVFVLLVSAQAKKEVERKTLARLVELNECEADATHFNFAKFPAGGRYTNAAHPYSHDLDVFGNGSLFQYINRCTTQLGENKLAADLTQPAFTKDTIQARQAAIKEMAGLIEFRQQCWAAGKQINEGEVKLDLLLAWLSEPDLFYGKKIFNTLKWLLPLLTCASLAAMYFNPLFQSVFILLMLAQLVIASAYNKPISLIQSNLSRYRSLLENYARIFQLMASQSFTSPWLKNHATTATAASAHVKKFSQLVNSVESRLNLIARIFGNGLFLYDFHSVNNLEHWRTEHAKTLPGWFQSLAEWDALLSFAAVRFRGNKRSTYHTCHGAGASAHPSGQSRGKRF